MVGFITLFIMFIIDRGPPCPVDDPNPAPIDYGGICHYVCNAFQVVSRILSTNSIEKISTIKKICSFEMNCHYPPPSQSVLGRDE